MGFRLLVEARSRARRRQFGVGLHPPVDVVGDKGFGRSGCKEEEGRAERGVVKHPVIIN
jgi:hypothetical protein